MLFVALLNVKAHSRGEDRLKMRAAWKYPDSIRVKGEYWLCNPDPHVILIYESDDETAALTIGMTWGDHFDVRVFQAVTPEQGFATGRALMAAMGGG